MSSSIAGSASPSSPRSSEQLSAFAAACEEDGAPSPVAVGTAAFRDAPNGTDAVGRAALAGVRMEIASEQRESELAYLVGSLGRDGYAVIDNGSRSIELVAKPGGALAAPRLQSWLSRCLRTVLCQRRGSGCRDRGVSRAAATGNIGGALHEGTADAGRRRIHGDGGSALHAGAGRSRLHARRAAGASRRDCLRAGRLRGAEAHEGHRSRAAAAGRRRRR